MEERRCPGKFDVRGCVFCKYDLDHEDRPLEMLAKKLCAINAARRKRLGLDKCDSNSNPGDDPGPPPPRFQIKQEEHCEEALPAITPIPWEPPEDCCKVEVYDEMAAVQEIIGAEVAEEPFPVQHAEVLLEPKIELFQMDDDQFDTIYQQAEEIMQPLLAEMDLPAVEEEDVGELTQIQICEQIINPIACVPITPPPQAEVEKTFADKAVQTDPVQICVCCEQREREKLMQQNSALAESTSTEQNADVPAPKVEPIRQSERLALKELADKYKNKEPRESFKLANEKLKNMSTGGTNTTAAKTKKKPQTSNASTSTGSSQTGNEPANTKSATMKPKPATTENPAPKEPKTSLKQKSGTETGQGNRRVTFKENPEVKNIPEDNTKVNKKPLKKSVTFAMDPPYEISAPGPSTRKSPTREPEKKPSKATAAKQVKPEVPQHHENLNPPRRFSQRLLLKRMKASKELQTPTAISSNRVLPGTIQKLGTKHVAEFATTQPVPKEEEMAKQNFSPHFPSDTLMTEAFDNSTN